MTKEFKPCYMMATKAYHKLGDLTRDEADLCYVCEETEMNYMGSWVTGFGFINVVFPKETTRPLTNAEIDKYNRMSVQINTQPPVRLKVNSDD